MTDLKNIKFSIITPTYNRIKSGYLLECIESIRNQKKGDYRYEHIIVNDGSVDNTKEFLEKESKKDSHIIAVNKDNGGPAKAWQVGLEKVTGDYVIFLDDDDNMTNGSLKDRAEFIENNPRVDWFSGNIKGIDEEGKESPPIFQTRIYKDHMYERMLSRNMIPSGCPVVKPEALKKIKWPKWLERSQDYFLWLELLRPEMNLEFGHLSKFVVYHRHHSGNYTSTLATPEKKKEKKKLNEKIRNLHPDGLSFMANRMVELESKAWKIEAYDYVVEQNRQLKRILESSKAWRFITFIRRVARKIRRMLGLEKV